MTLTDYNYNYNTNLYSTALQCCLTVPRCRLSTYGCRAFDYAGPTVWNSLPGELRNSDSFDTFERFMKTILLATTSVTSALEVIFIMRCITFRGPGIQISLY